MIYVILGGFFGAISRYLVTQGIHKYWPFSFPLATFIINMVGCFFIGLTFGFEQFSSAHLLLVIGFLGAFTTFSTFAVENVQLFLSKKPFMSLFYLGISITCGVLFTFLGYKLH